MILLTCPQGVLEGAECAPGNDKKLGTFSKLSECVKSCADKKGCKWFIYGYGKKDDRCFQENTSAQLSYHAFDSEISLILL